LQKLSEKMFIINKNFYSQNDSEGIQKKKLLKINCHCDVILQDTPVM